MPEPGLPHPELPMSVDAMVADAVLDTLRADAALGVYFKSVEPYEVEDLLTASSFAAPALGVLLDSTEERRTGGNDQAALTTGILLVIITDLADSTGTSRWLRARVADQIKRVLARDGGELHWQGRRVTEALLTFRRVSGAVRLGTGAHLLTRLVAEFVSDIQEATREFIA